MKKGERAVFKIPPKLGYGEKGSPPFVPPNATLIFEIEMLSWITVRDLTGDGGIMKKILREGEGWETPRDADEVLGTKNGSFLQSLIQYIRKKLHTLTLPYYPLILLIYSEI